MTLLHLAPVLALLAASSVLVALLAGEERRVRRAGRPVPTKGTLMTPTVEQLLHLADRARRGVALDAEHDQLTTGIAALGEKAARADRVARSAGREAAEALTAQLVAEAQLDIVYRERAHLVAHLAAIHPAHIGHTDPAAPEYAVVTVETPAGQMTWHIAERDRDLFAHVRTTADTDPVWDGHSTDEKYMRLRHLTEVEASLPPTTR